MTKVIFYEEHGLPSKYHCCRSLVWSEGRSLFLQLTVLMVILWAWRWRWPHGGCTRTLFQQSYHRLCPLLLLSSRISFFSYLLFLSLGYLICWTEMAIGDRYCLIRTRKKGRSMACPRVSSGPAWHLESINIHWGLLGLATHAGTFSWNHC